MNYRTHLKNLFKAGYAGVFIQSYEEQRVEADLAAIAKEIKFNVFVWSVTDSLLGPIEEGVVPHQMMDENGMPLGPDALLQHIEKKMPEKSIVIAKDFHLFLQDSNSVMIRKVKDALGVARNSNKRLVALGCRYLMCPELEKEFTLVEYQLPSRSELNYTLEGIAKASGIELNGDRDKVIDAASGMTTLEAGDAFALAVVETGGKEIDPAVVSREKCNVVKKQGILEIVESKVTLDDIGGLENLKTDLWEKRDLFTKEARDYGLQAPRGVLVVGQPGTGKSLTATACGTIFNIPLVKLEAGRLFASHVGESEGNWRKAFQTAKAISPCVLWIDEVDGLFSGGKSSGETDGGTTNRVLKSILQDMQFNSDGIFYFFTANDLQHLPDPLIDRLDVWSVDLPNCREREQIWKVQISKTRSGVKGRKPKAFDIPTIAKETDGYSGRQIEQIWLKALTLAYNDGKREPTDADILKAKSRFVATSITMAAQIEERKKRLQGKATPAGIPEESSQPKMRKFAD